MRFRTRPVEFVAFQWTGQSYDSFPEWFKKLDEGSALQFGVLRLRWDRGVNHLGVNPGDWVCLSSDGTLFTSTDECMKRVADPIEAVDGKEKD